MTAANIVMRLTDPKGEMIPGDCVIADFEHYIVLESWSLDLDTKKDKPNPSHLSFSKRTDRATVLMLNLMKGPENGKAKALPCKEAVIIVKEASHDSDLSLKITLRTVQLVKYSVNAKVEDKTASFSEDWDFAYESAKFEYQSYGNIYDQSETYSWAVKADALAMTKPKGDMDSHIQKLLDGVDIPAGDDKKLGELISRIQAAHKDRKLTAKPQAGTKVSP